MHTLAADVLALVARLETTERERDAFRIEADCGERDYDGLELDAGIMLEALQQIAEPRPNRVFDPWARDLARKTLLELRAPSLAAAGEAAVIRRPVTVEQLDDTPAPGIGVS